MALVLAIGGLFAYVQIAQPEPVVARGFVTASLVVEGNTWTLRYGPVATTNNTPFSLLLEASVHVGFSVRAVYYTIPDGVFVTAINGTTNGQSGMYWQYWVNGVYGNVAADHFPLPSGAEVLWRFTTDRGGMSG
jgi:hypothetical protein